MEAIIASIITSIVVSLFTFILGLKSGKNQADRALLQDLYKQLYAHFSELETGLKEKRPKRWIDYKCINDENCSRYYPIVREMERTGDILHINKRIARQASELELDCLRYKDKIDDLCIRVHDYIIHSPELFKSELIDVTYDRNRTNPWKIVETQNTKECRAYSLIPYEVMLDKERLIKALDSMDETDNIHGLAFHMRGNPPERQLTIYPDALAENNITFATNISDFAMKTMDCVASEKELLKRIETIKKILAKRAKDPTSFWETFAGAFADIFHT